MEEIHNGLARYKEDEEEMSLPDSFESEEQREIWIQRGYLALDLSKRTIKQYKRILKKERKEVKRIRKDIEKMEQLPVKTVIRLKE